MGEKSAIRHVHVLIDPATHPLLDRWVGANRWLWQPLLRDLAEQSLREGRLPAEVPFVRKRRARGPSAASQAAPAAGSKTAPVIEPAATLPPPSPADAAPSGLRAIARAAMMKNTF